jgi:hypothetical protein
MLSKWFPNLTEPGVRMQILNHVIVFSGLTAGPWSNAWKTGK